MKQRPAANRRKSQPLQVLEYLGAYGILRLTRVIPLKAWRAISALAGALIYYCVFPRRRIALENLRHAFPDTKCDKELRRIARQSCASFVASVCETVKFRSLADRPGDLVRMYGAPEGLGLLLERAHAIHAASGGCIFVTPHLGNWELLPFVGVLADIPLVVVVRPLDNKYIERMLYGIRSGSGQVIVPKNNSMLTLRRALRQGKSIGMLPDQRTIRALPVEFFGRKASTTPVPALLAFQYRRPIVVVACCRRPRGYGYEGFLSEPIWPDPSRGEKTEIFRLTREMNRTMEGIIRQHPAQYLWIHDRWRPYRTNKALSLA